MNRWEGLDEFVAVAECGQFSAAAERLGLSTSQVSRQVARLEERLQSRLFYRSTRRVALTEAGQLFLQHCQRLQDAREEALRAVGDLGAEPKGLLRMTCAVAYGERFIVPLVNDFMARHPQLRVEIELSNRPLDMLAVSWPRLRHVFHQFIKALFSAGGLAGVGKALQHALVGNADHASV